jgi:hypothetical protein
MSSKLHAYNKFVFQVWGSLVAPRRGATPEHCFVAERGVRALVQVNHGFEIDAITNVLPKNLQQEAFVIAHSHLVTQASGARDGPCSPAWDAHSLITV